MNKNDNFFCVFFLHGQDLMHPVCKDKDLVLNPVTRGRRMGRRRGRRGPFPAARPRPERSWGVTIPRDVPDETCFKNLMLKTIWRNT